MGVYGYIQRWFRAENGNAASELVFLGDEAQGGDKTPYGAFARAGFLRRVFGLELLGHARPNLDGQWSGQH